MDVKIVETIKRRRKEAKEQGLILHPEPLISEIRAKRKRILRKEGTLSILIDRTFVLLEKVAKNLRSIDFWAGEATSLLVGKLLP